MKIIILWTAVLFYGGGGFADEKASPAGSGKIRSVGQNSAESGWPARLQSSTQEQRKEAVLDWRTALPHFAPREILSLLAPRLSDRGRKVREIMPAVFTDLAESYPSLAPEIIETVGERVQGHRPERFPLIETAGKKGLSGSDYQIRLKTIELLTKEGIKYPSINSNIALLLSARQTKEQTHRVRTALKKALRALKKATDTTTPASSPCDRKLWRASSTRNADPL